MVKVLFITEKYHTSKEYGFTNNIYNLFGSFEASGLGEYENCFIDPEDIWSSAGVDNVLLTKPYDMAFVSVFHHLPSPQVTQQIGQKMCFGWWDGSVSLDGMKYYSKFCPQLCFDHGYGKEYPDYPNINCIDVPQDPKIFYRDDSVEKEFDVSFVGSIDAPRPDRRMLLERLKPYFNMWFSGGRGPGLLNMPITEYANIFRRSKICLNLQFGHGRQQRKGRSWECGSLGCFMMANNPQVFTGREGTWFDDGIDYISFDDNNVVDKIKYYLDHEEERKIIADNLYKKYNDNYSPRHFWKKVLGICGVQV